MIDVILCIVLVICAAFCAYTFYREKKVKKNSISFKESLDLANVPLITFTTETGTKLNFVLDTGAAMTTIDPRFLEDEVYKDINATNESVGLDGTKRESNVVAMLLIYKNNPYIGTFAVQDLKDSLDYLKSYSGITAHGIIGSDFFQRYQYLIDFKEMIAYAQK